MILANTIEHAVGEASNAPPADAIGTRSRGRRLGCEGVDGAANLAEKRVAKTRARVLVVGGGLVQFAFREIVEDDR